MSSAALSTLLRQAFEEAVREGQDLPGRREAPALAGASVRDMVRRVHHRAVAQEERDGILAAVIRCYRQGRSPAWSAVLLQMLAPALSRMQARFRSLPRAVDDQDVQQQLIVEALAAASSMPLPEPPRGLEQRVERRLATAMVRRLAGTAREPAWSYLEAAKLDLIAASEPGTSLASLLLLDRAGVLGEALAELALAYGCTPSAIQARERRALQRLRRHRPDLFRLFAQALPPAA